MSLFLIAWICGVTRAWVFFFWVEFKWLFSLFLFAHLESPLISKSKTPIVTCHIECNVCMCVSLLAILLGFYSPSLYWIFLSFLLSLSFSFSFSSMLVLFFLSLSFLSSLDACVTWKSTTGVRERKRKTDRHTQYSLSECRCLGFHCLSLPHDAVSDAMRHHSEKGGKERERERERERGSTLTLLKTCSK